MATNLNLVRNSRLFFTTNVDSAGVVLATGTTATNTYEIQVLDGFTFSQNTNADVVTLSEAGVAPIRGQRSFNTSLAPVDFAMSTYMRPYNAGTSITAEESVLWNALLGAQDISTANTLTLGAVSTGVTYTWNNSTGIGTLTIAGSAITGTLPAVGDVVVVGGIASTTPAGHNDKLNAAGIVLTASTTAVTIAMANPGTINVTATTLATASTVKLYKSAWAPVVATQSYVSAAGSNLNQLQKFGLIFVVDSVTYAVDNCAMNQVTLDFGLDAIATLAWTGQATALREIPTAVLSGSTFSGGLVGTVAAKNTSARYITNKLSTVSLSLVKDLGGAAVAGSAYAVALTGGSITINNNITYITPANLGVVNVPITYFMGTRSITGTLNAYLKTGTGAASTGQLLQDMLAYASTSVEPMVTLSISVGGGSNTTKVVVEMPAATISIPAIDVQQVVSTNINFTAQGFTPNTTANSSTFSLDKTSDLAVRYYAA